MDYKYIAYADDMLITQSPARTTALKAFFYPIAILTILLLGLAYYFFYTPSATAAPSINPTETLPGPNTQPATLATSAITVSVKPIIAPRWEIIKIAPKDTWNDIFKRAGILEADIRSVLALPDVKKYTKQLRPMAELHLLINSAHELQQINYPLNDMEILQVTRKNNNFQSQIIHLKPQVQFASAGATIAKSLGKAIANAKLHPKLSTQLASIFQEQVDFSKIRPGDRFHVLYEEAFIGNKKIRTGDIVAAEFFTRGKTYRAVRYDDGKGHIEYYTPEGLSLRKGFIRSPVNYSHISSGYSLRRFNPVTHRVRAHRGVDFAAPRGAPIRATGDGKIVFMGRKGGYGNAVMINHQGGKYSTLYAHMVRFAKDVRSGSTVHAGQTIGYVGSSGTSSGPHVHYEFRANGVHQNPLTVKLPNAAPVDRAAKPHFLAQTQRLLVQLDMEQRIRLASNASNKPHDG